MVAGEEEPRQKEVGAVEVAEEAHHHQTGVEEEEMHTARSALSQQSEVSLATERGGVPIARGVAIESRPDLSTAPQSFVTAPTMREDTTSSSGRTQRTWGTMDHYPQADWQPR